MAARTTPPYPRRSRRQPAAPARAAGRPRRAQARRDHRPRRCGSVEDQAIRDAVKLQEDIGLKCVTDGEFRRTFWHLDFLEKFANVTVIPPRIKARFHTHAGDIEFAPPGLRVDGKVAPGRARIFVDDFKFLKSVAHATPKQTIPSPSNMHFRGGRGAIDAKAYPDLAGFYADLGRVYSEEVKELAEAGCRYLQLDEVNFAYLCDPKLQRAGAHDRRGPQDPARDLCQADQRLDRDPAQGHGHHHASLPRQFPERLGGRGRL